MFIKRVTSLILIFLVVFSTQVQEEVLEETDTFALSRIQNEKKVAEEICGLPDGS